MTIGQKETCANICPEVNHGPKLRAAVVGLRMGAFHAAAYAALEEYELAALCDLSRPLLQQTADETGCHSLYTSYEQMLTEAKPDVVCITTPNSLH